MIFPKMTNKEFQALGRTPRISARYLLDFEGFRVRKLLTHEDSNKYSKEELEIHYKQPLSMKEILDLGECKF